MPSMMKSRSFPSEIMTFARDRISSIDKSGESSINRGALDKVMIPFLALSHSSCGAVASPAILSVYRENRMVRRSLTISSSFFSSEKKTVGTLLSTANGKAMSAAVDVWLSSSPSSISKRPGSRLSADISLIDLIVFPLCFYSE